MAETQIDLLIIGAGVSGIGIAHHFHKQFPDKSFSIIERRERVGGTWDLFRYPGIRSDSDIYTLGYSFKPWKGDESVVAGDKIRDYIEEAAKESDVFDAIQFGQSVLSLDWDSAEACWHAEIEDADTGERRKMRACFVAGATGYYSHEQGYSPEFPGAEAFSGEIIHPQDWPEDLDYSGKNVVIIGSGATAITLAPNMADKAGQVTLLQRSPSYVVSIPSRDKIVRFLRHLLPDRWTHAIARKKNIWYQQWIFNRVKSKPEEAKKILLNRARKTLDDGTVEKHFSPSYGPWDQRICMMPDNDLFNCVNDGSVEMVTDHIDHFTRDGIMLKSGREIAADIIITATGLVLKHLEGLNIAMDGTPISMSDRLTYKGMAYAGVPNFVSSFGYFNASWTMRVELTAEFICKLIAHMEQTGTASCMPVPSADEADAPRLDWLQGFSSGYVARGGGEFPKQTGTAPWVHTQSYDADKALVEASIEDGAMQFFAKPAALETAGLSLASESNGRVGLGEPPADHVQEPVAVGNP